VRQNMQFDDEASLQEIYNRPLSNFSKEISPEDTMYEGNANHYFDVGHSALRCVRSAMLAANKATVRNILDFASGFGRVLRMLKAAFPAADLTACDISREAVDFCAKAFGADPVQSAENPADIKFNKKFDLIWCGSLLTHLEAAPVLEFLGLLQSLLSSDGILVFTTHGPFVAQRLAAHAVTYGLDENALARLLGGYNAAGFGYADYPNAVLSRVGVTKYGFSVSKPSWVCRQIEAFPNLRLLTYTERGWDNHQDSIACANR